MEPSRVLREYGVPEKVLFCRQCTVSNQRPRITFDEQGVCSACRYADYKRSKVDWKEREKELMALCDRHRSTDGSYDILVPVSGGKDGGFVAHQLKTKYGMHPLTATWPPLLYTEIGRKNLAAFVRSGFDNVMGAPSMDVNRLLARLAFQHMGDPFQPFIYGQTNFPLQVAVQHGIPLIMYGENGEVEYGGDMKNAFRPTRIIQDHDKHYFSGKPPQFWKEFGLTEADLAPYLPPPYAAIQEKKIEIHFMGYYTCWDPQENFYYCMEHTGFQPNTERTEGTYSTYASLDDRTDGFHYWLGFVKFGIGRTTSDTAHEIRDGKITREEGVALVKRYDSEFPAKHFQDFLEFTGLTEEQFHESVDAWRSAHLWKKENGAWQLRHTVYDS